MNPDIVKSLFALGGAIVGSILTAFIRHRLERRSAPRKELAVQISRPSRLVSIDASISKNVTLLINGEEVRRVFRAEVVIVNSGNTTLHDLTVAIEVEGEAELIVLDIDHTNFEYRSGEVSSKITDPRAGEYTLSYLNPADELVGALLLTERPNGLKAKFRQPEVRYVFAADSIPEVPNIFAQTFFEALRSSLILHNIALIGIPEYRKYLKAKAARDKRRGSLAEGGKSV